MTKRPMTKVMEEALAKAIAHGGELVRWKGGFWTYRDCPVKSEERGYRVPVWHAGTQTVDGLIDRQKLEVIERGGHVGVGYPVRVKVAPQFQAMH